MQKPFDLKKRIDDFVHLITCGIISEDVRNSVQREYAEHLEDAVYHNQLAGMSEEEAFGEACRQLGNVEKLKELLEGIHNKENWYIYLIRFLLRRIKVLIRSKKFLKGFLQRKFVKLF